MMSIRTKRTDIDWSMHEVLKVQTPEALIHRIAKPNTVINSVTFINSCGVLAVTGDYGNWIFCREFHPSATGSVSDSYWCEKLRIASTQECYDYDSEGTRKEIEERMADQDDPPSREVMEYYQDLLDYHVDENKEMYLAQAHINKPSCLDHEDVPYCKVTKFWLKAVFDAFEEICERKEMCVE